MVSSSNTCTTSTTAITSSNHNGNSSLLNMIGLAIVAAVVSFGVGLTIGNTIGTYTSTTSSRTAITTAIQSTTTPSSSMRQQPQQRRSLSGMNDPDVKLSLLLETLNQYPVTAKAYVPNLPTSAGELKTVQDTALPELRAASWLLYSDTNLSLYNTSNKEDIESSIIQRYALATIYYATAGTGWTKSNNWLNSNVHHCNWYGVTCCKNYLVSPVCANITANPYGITELDLYNNNLITKQIPPAIVLLQDVQTIFLSENWISGTIDPTIFQPLPKLLRLHLQHNQLSGTVPDIYNGILDGFYVQGNDLTGAWPESYCKPCPSCATAVTFFGMDCSEVTCDTSNCCDPILNCFYHDPKLPKQA